MTEGTEAAADAITGALVAAAVERASAAPGEAHAPATCRNCGAALAGRYCSACGQAAHLHRSMASLGHDLLHSVFHFDGKFFRTLPELALFPGRLTRRYIDGERAKFVSPLALYLFTVFLMYAVFGLAGAPSLQTIPRDVAADLTQRSGAELPQSGHREAAARVDSNGPQELDAQRAARERTPPPPTAERTESQSVWIRALEQFRDNPTLTAFKLKTNGYKYSWLLVPLSIPFVWLLFAWRRDVLLYDHAVFVTYSISFMMMLMIVGALAQTAGGLRVVSQAVPVVAVVHMYRQLRGAYALSRAATAVRLIFLLLAAGAVLAVFMALLILLGAME